MFKKLFLILILFYSIFLQLSIKFDPKPCMTTDDEFLELISKYKSFQSDKYDLYYQEYQISNNIIMALNKVNYPLFFSDSYYFKSFSFDGGKFVNKNYFLDENYVPKKLVPVTINKITRKGETMMIDETVLREAKLMFNEAATKKLNLVVYSAYRSFVKQLDLYNNAKDKNYVAKPGYSEHQTGLALDISTLDAGLTTYFENTPEYEYLINNAHRFGFIQRYPKSKENLTLYPYESWHFRYVGRPLATFIYENNLTLEEYIYLYVELK